MNGISHKQAVEWIHRRLDGLLDEGKLSSLEEHLYSCEFCRTYAAELDAVPEELQSKFHARWDGESGPSHKVMKYVTTRARNIHRINRIASVASLLAGSLALIVLALGINFVASRLQSTPSATNPTETADPLPPAEDRLLAFTSNQSGNFDIYTMRVDGGGSTNVTNHPATDADPVWSPDGKRIAFQSDRDGFQQIYLMDADGSNVVQLTRDQTQHALMHYMNEFSAWSPDGTQLLISGALPGEEKWQLYVLDVKQGSKTPLIKEPNSLSASVISWSPDGQHIALLATNTERYENHIYIVNADGSGLREVTKSFPAEESVFTSDYHWSLDGRSFFFVGMFQKANYWTAYEARLDDDSVIELATTRDLLYGWWNGTYLVNNFSASAPFEWVRPDGTSSSLDPTEECEHIDLYQSDSMVKRSPNGSWVVTGQCANGDTWLYWANSDGTQIQRLIDTPISLTDTFLIPISWSDDDQFVVFTDNALFGSSDMYILNVSEALKDPSIQPVKAPDSAFPSWQPVP